MDFWIWIKGNVKLFWGEEERWANAVISSTSSAESQSDRPTLLWLHSIRVLASAWWCLASRCSFTTESILVDKVTLNLQASLIDFGLERTCHDNSICSTLHPPPSASRWACWESTSSPPKSFWKTPTCWLCCSSSLCSCREPSCRPPTMWPLKQASTCVGPFR